MTIDSVTSLHPMCIWGEVTSQNLWPRYDRHFVGIMAAKAIWCRNYVTVAPCICPQDGELIIQFETDVDEIRLLPVTERFLMVETSAYFEAYRHVLLALQDSTEADIPFAENIVGCNRQVEPPQYLRTADEPSYDLRCIAHANTRNYRDDNDYDSDVDDGLFVFFYRATPC